MILNLLSFSTEVSTLMTIIGNEYRFVPKLVADKFLVTLSELPPTTTDIPPSLHALLNTIIKFVNEKHNAKYTSAKLHQDVPKGLSHHLIFCSAQRKMHGTLMTVFAPEMLSQDQLHQDGIVMTFV